MIKKLATICTHCAFGLTLWKTTRLCLTLKKYSCSRTRKSGQHGMKRSRNGSSPLKERLLSEGNEFVTNCLQLKMVSPKDGKSYRLHQVP